MKKLKISFDGRGEVKGYHFKQLEANEVAYLYEKSKSNTKYYEVFKHKENSRFGVVSYPTANSFGVWAWHYREYSDALKKFNELSVVNND